ncbi:PfkB family carbohydrate kinase [Micromonosporaceae bacterium Da 78-11]
MASDDAPVASPLDVLVIGVANVDLVTHVSSLPAPGETRFGSELTVLPGGKGLNQAINVAQHGGRAALAASAGDDPWGRLLRRTLDDAGVDTAAFSLIPGGSTAGVLVQVPPGGDSAVTVTRTATTLPGHADLDRAQAHLQQAAVIVLQLELSLKVIDRALATAQGIKIGMLAPQQPLPRSTLASLDLIVVNSTEAALMLGRSRPEPARATAELASDLLRLGPGAAIVTMGPKGAAYAQGNTADVIPAPSTRMTDSTGAGDALLGVVGLTLAGGGSLADAVAAGVAAGSDAVQHRGAIRLE